MLNLFKRKKKPSPAHSASPSRSNTQAAYDRGFQDAAMIYDDCDHTSRNSNSSSWSGSSDHGSSSSGCDSGSSSCD